MCGIAGVARIDGGSLDTAADGLLRAMATALAHRGPDDASVLREGPVGLAFTRLSLVDPSGGSQPLHSDDGSLVLIANGEVYNHRELAASLPAGSRPRTGSDCEVLLYLYREYGLNFLDRVRGMFALILWDRRRNHLVLARDRFGIKPLYYHRDAHRIVLGSEMTSLFLDGATPRRLDWERALATPLLPAAPYLRDTEPATWFTGIESVPAATVLRIDLAGGLTREHRYWTFPGQPATCPDTAEDFIDSYRRLLAESVADCATADTELGVFLSGGIDSAVVAAMAADRAPDLHTFTVLCASTYRSEDAEQAHRVAAKLGLPNHQVVFEPDRVPDPAEWKRLLWLLETPLCGPEAYYKHELHRYAKQARPQLRGMLLGAASDEFNGGYSVDIGGDGGWEMFDANLRSMARAGALHERPSLAPWWAHGAAPLLSDDVIRRFTGRDVRDPYPAYLLWEYRTIQQYNVWHEDRTAAGSGIEARVPFLDHRLVELVASVPAHLRAELLWNKRILREAARGILPDETIERPKQPFFHGPAARHTYRMFLRMLSRDGGALVDEALAAPDAGAFIDADGLRGTLRRLADDPGSEQIEIALRVVNLGLLASMAARLPDATVRTPIAAPPPAVTIRDWVTEQPAIERAVGLWPAIDPSATPRLAGNALLLCDPATPGSWYLAVDGSIEFVLSEDDPEVLPLLRAFDGRRRLSDVFNALGRTPDEVYPTLVRLVEQDLVELS